MVEILIAQCHGWPRLVRQSMQDVLHIQQEADQPIQPPTYNLEMTMPFSEIICKE